MGYKGDIDPSDPKIKESLNKEFIAEAEAKTQKVENQKAIDKAEADAKVINKMAETMDKQIRLKELEIKMKQVENEAKAIEK